MLRQAPVSEPSPAKAAAVAADPKDPMAKSGTLGAGAPLAPEEKKPAYVSPYDSTCPLDYVVIHNRSKNANNFAIRKLREAWPTLKIIQVVKEGREAVPGADAVIEVTDWNSTDQVQTQLKNLARRDPDLREKLRQKDKVGFYSVWSAQAEDAEWATAVQRAGFKWIGASPDKMRHLDKTDLKKLALGMRLPTAPFVEIPVPPEVETKEAGPETAKEGKAEASKEAFKEATLRAMALQVVKAHTSHPDLTGKAVFLKHNKGGGGRGSKKIGEMTFDNALAALRKIVNETGGDPNGVYMEQALDLEGAQLFQLELEVDAGSLAQGGRLVWFNRENQKVLEIGLNDEEMSKRIPRDIYLACREAAQKVAAASGYDSRGTLEILISKNRHGRWSYNLLEFNKRIQVENEALAELVVDKKGRTRNVPAEQVMRAFGSPPPLDSDFEFRGPGIVVHKRLLSCKVKQSGTEYNEVDIHGALYAQDANVQFVKGPVHFDADPQAGREIITAGSWEEMCSKLLRSSQEFQFFGPGTELSSYDAFFRKLASNPEFRAGTLGCNRTFDVLDGPPVEAGLRQRLTEELAFNVTPLVTHGYRYDKEKGVPEGVKDQPYPTPSQIQEFLAFMEGLKAKTPPGTPFSQFLEHRDYNRYVAELKATLVKHGGGTVTVFPRDVMQSMGDQESALLQHAAAQIAEIYFAGTGIGVGYETGGAQFQSALMRRFHWMPVLLSGCLSNLPSHSLTRSLWMNGLDEKTPSEQAFIFKTIALEIAKLYGWPPGRDIPWAPYNFHAGNHPDQDITTAAMLQAGFMAIPCWAWDSRYAEEQFTGWVRRQIALFKKEGKPLDFIRIKDAGQGKGWSADGIVKMVNIIRQECSDNKLPEPVIYIHNHEFDGGAARIGAEALIKCQAQGFRQLVVDSAPPGLSHNSNLVIADALVLDPVEKASLRAYNKGSQLLLNLASRFNIQNTMRTYGVQDPHSDMAGGTGSSDLASALELDIDPGEIADMLAVARELTGLGTAVTPFSEWIKQIGIAIWKNKDIQPKTVGAARAHITKGGTLPLLAPNILEGLRKWKTLLPRPPIVETLLRNHGITLEAKVEHKEEFKPFDKEARRTELAAELSVPATQVSDLDLATAVAFGRIGKQFLKDRHQTPPVEKRVVPRELTAMMPSPAFVHSREKKMGDCFTLFGQRVAIHRIAPGEQPGQVQVDYRVNSEYIVPTIGVDPFFKPAATASSAVRMKANPACEGTAPMLGKLVEVLVTSGAEIKEGQPLAIIEVMKMQHTINAAQDGRVDWITPNATPGRTVKLDEVLVAFKPKAGLTAHATVGAEPASLKR